jgi:hypothetical protein
MENTDLPDSHLLYEEEEKDFENVIPEFGDCGGGEVDVDEALAKGASGSKTCCKDSLVSSST